MTVFALRHKAASAREDVTTHTVEDVYRAHGDFVWASLQRCGVRPGDLDDALQEVFVVVHRRLDSFRGESQMTTWLYGICLRVASAHRRRSHVRRERAMQELEEWDTVEPCNPEDEVGRRQRQRVLEALLDELDIEKRALLVMFEIDELSCDDIAGILGVPVGTVYSRLHAARKCFASAVSRFHARARGASS